ncbi:MAG: asparagine synthase-related protein, partial [Hyphomonadaceae bacterium]
YAARARDMLARVCGPSEDGGETIIDRMGVLVGVKGDSRDGPPLVLPDQLGLVLGRLFARGGEGEPGRLVTEVSTASAFDLASGGGEGLVRSHWGPYCAILHDRFADTLRIVRDPMGARPIFHTVSDELAIAFTHLRDFFACGIDAGIDDWRLRAFLTDVRLVSERTGIEGVRELLAGSELRLGRDAAEVATVWRPEQPRRRTHDDFEGAAAAVRAKARAMGEAWAQALPRALHRLSGGLDSSIALALITRGKHRIEEIVAVNEFSAFAESDERAQARAAADWFGVKLIERQVDADRIDYRGVLDHEPEASPSLAALGFADEGLASAAPDFAGAPLTSGQGGDQIFHRSSRAVLVADAVRDGLPAREVWRVAYDNALLAKRPVWEGVGAGLKYGLLRLPFDGLAQLDSPVIWRLDGEASSDAFLAEAWGAHPWKASKETPARAERVRRVIDLAYYHQPSPLTTSFQNTPVLASQPLVEACLSIAPYLMSAHGKDRALARTAFGEDLPPSVLKRQTKGDTTRFVAEMLRRNLPFVRAMLVGGRLVEREILSPGIVDQLVAPRAGLDGMTKTRLMRSLAAELWLRRVESARREIEARASSQPPAAQRTSRQGA